MNVENSFKHVIEYLNAPCAAGKTYQIAKIADWLARHGFKVIIIQPGKELIDKTIECEFGRLQAQYSVTCIHSELTDSVISDIVRHMNAAEYGRGEVLIITMQAYLRLPNLSAKGNWIAIIDEIPQVEFCDPMPLRHNHRILFDVVELDDVYREGKITEYALLRERTGSQTDHSVGSMADNKDGDVVFRIFQDLSNRIRSSHWDVYVRTENYRKVLDGEAQSGTLYIHNVLKSSVVQGFQRVIIAGANFTDSILFKLWSREPEVRFEAAPPSMTEQLRYLEHPNGKLLSIEYLIEEPWSKRVRDKDINVGGIQTTLRKHLSSHITLHLNGRPFVWLGNKDLGNNYFRTPLATRLPNTPHGLNSYSAWDCVVVLSALNPSPQHFAFLEFMGVTGEEVRIATAYDRYYQAVMRISLRDLTSTSTKIAVVPDLETALWLKSKFNGSMVRPLGGAPIPIELGEAGRPAIFDRENDKKRVSKIRCRMADEHEEINAPGFEAKFCKIRPDEMFYGTAFLDIRSTEGEPILHPNTDSYISFLRECYSQTYSRKEANMLISPALFSDVKGCKTKRGLGNVKFLKGILLDNDGGGITAEEFAALFPNWRMVIWSTYSSSLTNPRWRCYIPTATKLTVSLYNVIVRYISTRLKDEGYEAKLNGPLSDISGAEIAALHGFDTSKFNAASVFYAPCQPADVTAAYFADFNGPERVELNPADFLESTYLKLMYGTEEQVKMARKQREITTSIWGGATPVHLKSAIVRRTQELRSAPAGDGHSAFVRLASALRWAGHSETEIRQTLESELSSARSPEERAAEIPSIASWAVNHVTPYTSIGPTGP